MTRGNALKGLFLSQIIFMLFVVVVYGDDHGDATGEATLLSLNVWVDGYPKRR